MVFTVQLAVTYVSSSEGFAVVRVMEQSVLPSVTQIVIISLIIVVKAVV